MPNAKRKRRQNPYDIPRMQISYLSQRQNVFGDMTAEENIQVGAWTSRKDKALVDQNIRQAVEKSDYIYVLELGRNKVDGPKDKFKDLKDILWF